jgi:hypothetical protein
VPANNRSAGTTAIAILQFIGSALLLAMAAFMAFAMFVAPTPPANDAQLPPHFFTAMRVVLPLFYALPAVWGIVTAVGLLQLKNWARISTIVISVLLIVFGAFTILTSMVFFLKPPPGNGVDPKFFAVMGVVTAVFALAEIGVGVWWMVFCNRASVKAQFLPQAYPLPYPTQTDMPYSATPPPPSLTTPADLTSTAYPTAPIVAATRTARPLSISIIAWFMLVSCLLVPFNILLRAPAVLFTTILTGWPAMVLLLVFTALNLYTGIALLQMKHAGRLIAIGYFLFGLLNFAVFYLAPGRSARIARLMEVEQSMFPWMRSTQANSAFGPEMMPIFIGTGIGIVAVFLVLIYFLAAAKPAFDKAARERAG